MTFYWPALAAIVAGLGIYTVTVMADAALALAGHNETRRLAGHGNLRARTVEAVLARKRRWTATAVLLRVGALFLTGAAALLVVQPQPSTGWLALIYLLLWLLFAAAQMSARLWVQGNPTTMALRLVPFVRFALWLMTPVTAPLRQLTERLRDGVDGDEDSILLSDNGVRLVLPNDGEENEIEESEKEMIASILEMDETVVREVMVPRIDMTALDADSTVNEALEVIIAVGHSRIPVYEGNVDHIVGMLYAKDLLRVFHEQETAAPLRSLLRPAYFVPLTKNVKTLLAELRKRRVHIAVVVDEYGGTAGLVTIEDILEEIVGEIQDEFDGAEEMLVQRSGNDSYLLSGRNDIYSLSKLLDADLEDEDADTIGGLVLGLLGHVPDPGENVEHAGWRFTVLSVDGRRIEQLRADPLAPKQEPDEPAHQRAATRHAPNSVKLTSSDSQA